MKFPQIYPQKNREFRGIVSVKKLFLPAQAPETERPLFFQLTGGTGKQRYKNGTESRIQDFSLQNYTQQKKRVVRDSS